jgi:peptidoglycan hydrolase CwlO-like protein
MSKIPPFHPDWLVTFWFSTPGLKEMNPHLLLSMVAIIVLVIFFIKKTTLPAARIVTPTVEEEQFYHLLKKKQIIEQKMSELREWTERGELAEEKYQTKLSEYNKHLDKVNKELLYFT